jgi:hypothetical protein
VYYVHKILIFRIRRLLIRQTHIRFYNSSKRTTVPCKVRPAEEFSEQKCFVEEYLRRLCQQRTIWELIKIKIKNQSTIIPELICFLVQGSTLFPIRFLKKKKKSIWNIIYRCQEVKQHQMLAPRGTSKINIFYVWWSNFSTHKKRNLTINQLP